ncbi:hypothetical protein LCGC14_2874810, partial [marine sediment metagenome]
MAKDKKTTKAASAKRAKPAPASPGKPDTPKAPYVRYCLVILLAGAALLAWLSVLSYHPNDPPSSNVFPPQAVRNAGGIVGAYLAHGLLYWLGDGAYALLLFATIVAVIM